jgi:GNAT superfamily N-acetyltransferase
MLRAHVVAPASRGLGIGTRLLSFVEHAEGTNGRRALLLDGMLASSTADYYAGRGYRPEELVRRGPGDPPPLFRRLGSDPSEVS